MSDSLPYKQQWQELYPDKQFPTPQKYPHMFSGGSRTEQITIIVDPFNPECSDPKTCKKGLIDYQCQYQHSCYFNLLELGITLLGFCLGLILFMVIIGKLVSFLYHFLTGIVFIHRMIQCVLSCLKCLSFGSFDGRTIQIREKKFKPDFQNYERKLQQIGVQIDIEHLSEYKLKKIKNVLDDFQIDSDS